MFNDDLLKRLTAKSNQIKSNSLYWQQEIGRYRARYTDYIPADKRKGSGAARHDEGSKPIPIYLGIEKRTNCTGLA
jgi:hypothetical protein